MNTENQPPPFVQGLKDAFKQGLALHQEGQLAQAKAIYEQVLLAAQPAHFDALHLLGVIAQQCHDSMLAVALIGKAIAINPNDAAAHSNLGIALQALKRNEDAVASFDRAIAIKPDYADANLNKSLALLLSGDYENAWPLFYWRWNDEEKERNKSNSVPPLWLGLEDLKGTTVLLHSEQGLGDSIQFGRYAKLVSDLGARVLLETPKALAGLLGTLEGVSAVIESGQALPSFDYHCPLMSLPLAFKTTLSTIPFPTPYLVSDTQKRVLWRERLGAKTKPRVGLVWSGSTGHKNDHNRSLTLAQVLQHLPANYDYVSLQKEVRDVDKETLNKSSIRHFGDALTDYTDTAALCDLMDIVVSVDTSVVHLSGALGKKTWVLLPYVPDWRWLLDREDNPWYESVKLYRQEVQRDWDDVLARVAADLALLFEEQNTLNPLLAI